MPFAFTVMLEPVLHSRHSTPRSRPGTRGTNPRGCCRLQFPIRAEKKTPRSTPASRCPHPEPSPAPYPLGQLRVHHEVVDVLLRFGELQLPGHHGHHQGCAAGALHGDSKDGGGHRDVGWGVDSALQSLSPLCFPPGLQTPITEAPHAPYPRNQ